MLTAEATENNTRAFIFMCRLSHVRTRLEGVGGGHTSRFKPGFFFLFLEPLKFCSSIKLYNISIIDEKMTQPDLACALLRFLSEDSLPHGAAAALPKPGITSRAS